MISTFRHSCQIILQGCALVQGTTTSKFCSFLIDPLCTWFSPQTRFKAGFGGFLML